mmetsp:Transcript_96130/g.176072  ORF Transcript_96130/g.176072 Transcript_96130/m.176072 type:complete len:289 (-) Transcript_96130:55-921(-)
MIALTLACLACVGHAAAPNPLTELLLSSNPAAAWQVHGPAQGSGVAGPHSAVKPVMQEAVPERQVPAEAVSLAAKLNPVIGYWDPLSLASLDFWGQGNDATWGWLRHAEIKHGRVAMAAFVGYCIQANGIHWPFALQGGGVEQTWYKAGLSPPEQWDALPKESKIQILVFIGFLEWWSEFAGEKHYMRGGKPGVFPSFTPGSGESGVSMAESPHNILRVPVLNLYDPFGFNKNLSEEKKATSLLAEINNGRLAMLGIFAFLAEAKVPGAVPALSGIVKPYAGEVMAPF